jgi:hypothetical protein
MRKHHMADAISDLVAARARDLGFNAFSLARACDGAVSDDLIRDFFSGKKAMATEKLQHVLQALGLRLTVDKSFRLPK